MVGGEHDHGAVEHGAGAQRIEQATELRIEEAHFSVVARAHECGVERVRAQPRVRGHVVARDALARAREAFERAAMLLQSRQGELVAEELRLAQQALGEITGEFDNEALLGEIFGSFCIGK